MCKYNNVNKIGDTSLITASERGNKDIVSLLLRYEADVNSVNKVYLLLLLLLLQSFVIIVTLLSLIVTINSYHFYYFIIDYLIIFLPLFNF